MSTYLRPIVDVPHGKQGNITQPFLGDYSAEPKGWVKKVDGYWRGRRQKYPGATYKAHVHLAIDYSAAIGTPVYAVHAGKIVAQGKEPSTGEVYLMLRVHKTETTQVIAFYTHLSKLRRKVGDKVTKGAVIAESGMTGIGSGPHLHHDLRVGPVDAEPTSSWGPGWKFVDPQPLIDGHVLLADIA